MAGAVDSNAGGDIGARATSDWGHGPAAMDLIERQVLDPARRHPWEVARARTYVALLERTGVLAGAARVLDAGAGDAFLATELRQALPHGAEVVCWDTNYSEDDLARLGAGAGLEVTAERPAGRFDGILLLDVIEHVEDDRGFLADLVDGSLAPAGWVLVGVPAYQALFSSHDEALRHHRRYAPRQLHRVLESAGLRVEGSGSLFHLLLPVRAAQVARERFGGRPVPAEGVGAWEGSPGRTAVLTAVLEWEGRASLALARRHLGVVPGLSTWALCRRRAEDGR